MLLSAVALMCYDTYSTEAELAREKRLNFKRLNATIPRGPFTLHSEA